jgi:betaine-aldehyde dehydrogenase
MSSYSTKLFVNGASREAAMGETIPQVNPLREVFCEVSAATVADVNVAVAGAETFAGWRDLIPRQRADILFQVARRIRDNLESLATLESRNIGKPISDARDEIALGARVFEYYAGAISKFYGQTIPVARGGFDFTLRQPMGVIAAIVPWNFPFPIACWKVAPALAAGNTVLLKPASQSPLTAIQLGILAHEAGLPPGVLQVLPGAGASGDVLATHPRVRKNFFTSSTEIGARLMGLAARDLKRLSLELGGKSPKSRFR